MKIEGNHIIAEEGKTFRRKGTEDIFGHEIYLGKSYYISGVKLETPHTDIPEDFEEIDDPDLEPVQEEDSDLYN